jgi:hypothetical protein
MFEKVIYLMFIIFAPKSPFIRRNKIRFTFTAKYPNILNKSLRVLSFLSDVFSVYFIVFELYVPIPTIGF